MPRSVTPVESHAENSSGRVWTIVKGFSYADSKSVRPSSETRIPREKLLDVSATFSWKERSLPLRERIGEPGHTGGDIHVVLVIRRGLGRGAVVREPVDSDASGGLVVQAVEEVERRDEHVAAERLTRRIRPEAAEGVALPDIVVGGGVAAEVAAERVTVASWELDDLDGRDGGLRPVAVEDVEGADVAVAIAARRIARRQLCDLHAIARVVVLEPDFAVWVDGDAVRVSVAVERNRLEGRIGGEVVGEHPVLRRNRGGQEDGDSEE